MFDIEDDASRREKCFTTVAQLPAWVDSKQIPSTRSPFSTIRNHSFAHTVEAILPAEAYESVQAALDARIANPEYARVFMAPSALLEHEFFNAYIKAGNILMISEGRSGSDTVFMLKNGTLQIELGREVFERTGLSGKPCRSGGRKHGKERYLVELNLRLPSMLHGKQGFERIVWAFKNVLNQSLAWLFCDLEESTPNQKKDKKPIHKLQPQWLDCAPFRIERRRVLTPQLQGNVLSDSTAEDEIQEKCGSLAEWIAMVQLQSPRVSADDEVDPYLCRYSVPDHEPAQPSDLVCLKWHGLISSNWAIQLFHTLL
ncbi:uncharacterized protein PFLUO_LOCUS8931 [Penicillium psychrofluorescens]|uniref:uncharacterized protein n=1 Tax=Penicillium psychrofluorescens TaxID=3158075 RepID=UPI003CCE0A77